MVGINNTWDRGKIDTNGLNRTSGEGGVVHIQIDGNKLVNNNRLKVKLDK